METLTTERTKKLVGFERNLVNRGFAVAPNGASYRLGTNHDGHQISVRRVSRDGKLDNIVGFSGAVFQSFAQAFNWAMADARHAPPFHTELSKRTLIA